jgi:hypothetical protein
MKENIDKIINELLENMGNYVIDKNTYTDEPYEPDYAHPPELDILKIRELLENNIN